MHTTRNGSTLLLIAERANVHGRGIIEGGVANDRVIDAVEAYINGYADVEHTLRQLVYHKPNYQICILNQQITDEYLQYKSNERV